MLLLILTHSDQRVVNTIFVNAVPCSTIRTFIMKRSLHVNTVLLNDLISFAMTLPVLQKLVFYSHGFYFLPHNFCYKRKVSGTFCSSWVYETRPIASPLLSQEVSSMAQQHMHLKPPLHNFNLNNLWLSTKTQVGKSSLCIRLSFSQKINGMFQSLHQTIKSGMFEKAFKKKKSQNNHQNGITWTLVYIFTYILRQTLEWCDTEA